MTAQCAFVVQYWSSNKGTIRRRQQRGVADAVPKLRNMAIKSWPTDHCILSASPHHTVQPHRSTHSSCVVTLSRPPSSSSLYS